MHLTALEYVFNKFFLSSNQVNVFFFLPSPLPSLQGKEGFEQVLNFECKITSPIGDKISKG